MQRCRDAEMQRYVVPLIAGPISGSCDVSPSLEKQRSGKTRVSFRSRNAAVNPQATNNVRSVGSSLF